MFCTHKVHSWISPVKGAQNSGLVTVSRSTYLAGRRLPGHFWGTGSIIRKPECAVPSVMWHHHVSGIWGDTLVLGQDSGKFSFRPQSFTQKQKCPPCLWHDDHFQVTPSYWGPHFWFYHKLPQKKSSEAGFQVLTAEIRVTAEWTSAGREAVLKTGVLRKPARATCATSSFCGWTANPTAESERSKI